MTMPMKKLGYGLLIAGAVIFLADAVMVASNGGNTDKALFLGPKGLFKFLPALPILGMGYDVGMMGAGAIMIWRG